MKHQKTVVLSIISLMLISLLAVPIVDSFMPPHHLYIWNKATAEPMNTDFYTLCMKYPNLCYSGDILIDIGVYYYYTQGAKYQTTHSPSFCKLLLENAPKIPNTNNDPNWGEKMKSCAVGGCTHGPADLASHGPNGMVQHAILNSFLVNAISHVLAEQHASNIIEARDPSILDQQFDFLNSAGTCQDLYVTSMLGTDAYKDMGKAELDNVYASFVQEILTSQNQGNSYNPAFKEKSFLGSIDSIPFSIVAIYVSIMSIFLLLNILLVFKIFKKQAKVRHFAGIIIFGFLFVILAWFFISAMQGTVFASFVTFIRPISNFMPIGNVDTYTNMGIQNTINVLRNGETSLEGTDPSGLGTNPVLIEASEQVLIVDYIILAVILILFFWFVWYLFKKNKVIQSRGGFSL